MNKLGRKASIYFIGAYGTITLLLRFYYESTHQVSYLFSILIGVIALSVLLILVKLKFLNFNDSE
ncbi:MAG: hypothetical protein RLO81_09125 [Fulvivirga sp.]|uniref:hypothetical protein n=1 Tax=Fulvivirga sp. TaxID=1931237 RepID=UPI0032EB552B